MPATHDPETGFYRDILLILNRKNMPYLVGGAFAFKRYTSIARDTKDLDIFCLKSDVKRILKTLENAGYRTELTFPHWLGKAFSEGERYVDVIYSSGNGLCPVDSLWFKRAVKSKIFGIPVRMMPPEEMIWQKAFIMERERYDGADVAHLIRSCGNTLDWAHLLRRFDANWRVLFAHLALFAFTYPSEKTAVPHEVLLELAGRFTGTSENGKPHVCRGTLLSRAQYLTDIRRWGYEDARLRPEVGMTRSDVKKWTEPVTSKP